MILMSHLMSCPKIRLRCKMIRHCLNHRYRRIRCCMICCSHRSKSFRYWMVNSFLKPGQNSSGSCIRQQTWSFLRVQRSCMCWSGLRELSMRTTILTFSKEPGKSPGLKAGSRGCALPADYCLRATAHRSFQLPCCYYRKDVWACAGCCSLEYMICLSCCIQALKMHFLMLNLRNLLTGSEWSCQPVSCLSALLIQ